MKRLLFMLLVALSWGSAAMAENVLLSFLTLGENDTVRLSAADLGRSATLPVHALFDGRTGRWSGQYTWPAGLSVVSATEGPDMTVSYMNSQGEECLYNAVLTWNSDKTMFMSTIMVQGYVDIGTSGPYYYCYGKAKWPAGYYDEMYYLTLDVDRGFTGGQITIDGMLVGNDDWVGGCIGQVVYYKEVQVIVMPCARGDVNCDGSLGIADVTALIALLLNGTEDVNPYILAGCDVTGEGNVSINDVTALIALLLQQ